MNYTYQSRAAGVHLSRRLSRDKIALRATKRKDDPWGSKRVKEEEMFAGPCPCNSLETYRSCCSAIHKGRWAKTSLELALARFSARMIQQQLPSFISETTHPEALDLVGGRTQLERKSERLGKRYKDLKVRLVDSCSGPVDDDDKDPRSKDHAWLVALALEFEAAEGARDVSVVVERYLQMDGRWWYQGEEDEIPTGGTWGDFTSRHCGVQQPTDGEGGGDDEERRRRAANVKADGSSWRHEWSVVRPVRPLAAHLDDYAPVT